MEFGTASTVAAAVDVHVEMGTGEANSVSISCMSGGKTHNMTRPRSELLSNTIQRFLAKVSTSKSRGKKGNKKIAEVDATTAGCAERVDLFNEDGVPLDGAAFTNAEWKAGMTFIVGTGPARTMYRIVVNPPTVLELSMFPKNHLMVGSRLVVRARSRYADTVAFRWFAVEPSDGREEYWCVGEGEVFIIPPELLGHRLKLSSLPTRDTTTCATGACTTFVGRECVFYSSGTVCPSTGLQRLIQELSERPLDRSENFRVMSYNLLADVYASSAYAREHLFGYVADEKYITEDYRSQLIVNELMAASADIMLLQEVEQKLYDIYLTPCLVGVARESFLEPFVHRYTNKNGNNREGCAVFVRRSKFNVVYELDIPLNYAVMADPDFKDLISSSEAVADILGARVGTIAQLTVVQETRDPCNLMIVVNSHYYYHPDAGYIRLIHTKVIIDIVQAIKKQLLKSSHGVVGVYNLEGYLPSFMRSEGFLNSITSSDMANRFTPPQSPSMEAEGPLRVAVVYAGDLNSRPGVSVLQFLERGEIPSCDSVWQGIADFRWSHRQDGDQARRNPLDVDSSKDDFAAAPHITHDFSFLNVAPTEEKYYTNYTPGFKDVLDYIFIDKEQLEVAFPPSIATEDELSAEIAIPSSLFPSDHIPLVTDIRFKTCPTTIL